jgi:hypothetical protein
MNESFFERGNRVVTPDGNGVVLMPCTPGWNRCTVLVANHRQLPFQRDYYESALALRTEVKK